jgi:hypothetical protein
MRDVLSYELVEKERETLAICDAMIGELVEKGR